MSILIVSQHEPNFNSKGLTIEVMHRMMNKEALLKLFISDSSSIKTEIKNRLNKKQLRWSTLIKHYPLQEWTLSVETANVHIGPLSEVKDAFNCDHSVYNKQYPYRQWRRYRGQIKKIVNFHNKLTDEESAGVRIGGKSYIWINMQLAVSHPRLTHDGKYWRSLNGNTVTFTKIFGSVRDFQYKLCKVILELRLFSLNKPNGGDTNGSE